MDKVINYETKRVEGKHMVHIWGCLLQKYKRIQAEGLSQAWRRSKVFHFVFGIEIEGEQPKRKESVFKRQKLHENWPSGERRTVEATLQWRTVKPKEKAGDKQPSAGDVMFFTACQDGENKEALTPSNAGRVISSLSVFTQFKFWTDSQRMTIGEVAES